LFADLRAYFRPSSDVGTQGDFGRVKGGHCTGKMRLMSREVTVVASRTFSVATDDQTSMINFKPIFFIDVLPMHSRLSLNLHTNNILLPEERGFTKGMCVESAAFRPIGSVFKECMLEEFSLIG
jgi:hypothetical protein